MKSINEKQTELSTLVIPHRSTPVMQRIQAFCVEKTGKKLTEFLANGDTEEKKHELLDSLIGIISEGRFDELPKIPGGQAAAQPQPAAAKPAAKPKPAPAPAPAENVIGPVGAAATPTPAPQTPASPPAPVAAEPDPVTAIAEMLHKLQKPAQPGLTAAEVRKIVREELASIFQLTAGALQK